MSSHTRAIASAEAVAHRSQRYDKSIHILRIIVAARRRRTHRGGVTNLRQEEIGLDMKRIFWSTVSTIALASATQAADLSPAYKAPGYSGAPPAWAGGYIGIQGGVARQDATFTNNAILGLPSSTDHNKTGATFGGLAGYNWQHGSFVYGVEGDWSWIGAKITDDNLPNSSFGGFGFSSSFDVKWLATVGGRAGLALDATLLYVTGGLAFGKVNNSFQTFLTDGTPFQAFS